MKKETLSQSSFLDLLFENRNKQYGAYELRKNYPKRLKKAILGSFTAIILLFFILSSFKRKTEFPNRTKPVLLDDITVAKPDIPKEEKVKPKTLEKLIKGTPAEKMRKNPVSSTQLQYTNETDFEIPDMDLSSNPNGDPEGKKLPTGPIGELLGNTKKDTITTKEIVMKIKEIETGLIPPTDASYWGGKEALGAYLQDQLGDEAIEDNEPKRITVSYTIETNGEVTNVNAYGNEDADFVKKTIKTFQKMKKWKPATQNGQAVKTAHTIPIIIQPSN